MDRREFVTGLGVAALSPALPAYEALAAPPFTVASAPEADIIPLWAQHPSTAPDDWSGAPDLFNHPGAYSSTARWIYFLNKTLLPWIVAEPHNPFPRLFVGQVEKILVYRQAQPLERRWWRKDALDWPHVRALSASL